MNKNSSMFRSFCGKDLVFLMYMFYFTPFQMGNSFAPQITGLLVKLHLSHEKCPSHSTRWVWFSIVQKTCTSGIWEITTGPYDDRDDGTTTMCRRPDGDSSAARRRCADGMTTAWRRHDDGMTTRTRRCDDGATTVISPGSDPNPGLWHVISWGWTPNPGLWRSSLCRRTVVSSSSRCRHAVVMPSVYRRRAVGTSSSGRLHAVSCRRSDIATSSS